MCIKMSFLPFKNTATEPKFPGAFDTEKGAGNNESRRSTYVNATPFRGLIGAKVIRNVDSLECRIEMKEGEKTTLREFILTRKHKESRKTLFSGVKPALTEGNVSSVKTEFSLT